MNRGGMGNMQKMMKQMQKMQKDMAKAQEELVTKTIEGSAGGGMVTVTINGNKEVTDVPRVHRVQQAEHDERQ